MVSHSLCDLDQTISVQFGYGYVPLRTVFLRGGRIRPPQRRDARGRSRHPMVQIMEDLGTIEVPCGKVDCRANCLEYLVRSSRAQESYALAE